MAHGGGEGEGEGQLCSGLSVISTEVVVVVATARVVAALCCRGYDERRQIKM